MSTTGRKVIEGTLKLIGVLDPVDTMEAQDAEDGLEVLNDMVDQWGVEELNIFTTTDVTATFAGATATFGAGGTINATRPTRLNHAFYRDAGQDRPLLVLRNRQSYDEILDKAQGGLPDRVFFEATAPLATVRIWPVPGSTQYTFNVDAQFTQFADLDTAYDFPPGYNSALKHLLCEPLAPMYGKPLSPDLKALIRQSRRILKRGNIIVPELELEFPDKASAVYGGRLGAFLGG